MSEQQTSVNEMYYDRFTDTYVLTREVDIPGRYVTVLRSPVGGMNFEEWEGTIKGEKARINFSISSEFSFEEADEARWKIFDQKGFEPILMTKGTFQKDRFDAIAIILEHYNEDEKEESNA